MTRYRLSFEVESGNATTEDLRARLEMAADERFWGVNEMTLAVDVMTDTKADWSQACHSALSALLKTGVDKAEAKAIIARIAGKVKHPKPGIHFCPDDDDAPCASDCPYTT